MKKYPKNCLLKNRSILNALLLLILPLLFLRPCIAQIDTTNISFNHGVASGDPTFNKVILWTRVTTERAGAINVEWAVSKDRSMNTVIKSGKTSTDISKDYTVKVDVSGLAPATTYYYQFKVEKKTSIIGKTKTAPVSAVSILKFAVVSCSNYAEGYFSALGRIADRNNLDAVIHLGDYIYEGTERSFTTRESPSINSKSSLYPAKSRSWWLNYYRERYAISHLDSNLSRAHQQHPFITIWDDHETADNAYANGASGHNPDVDGNWPERKSAAIQAYFEWMPIRGNTSPIYRNLKFGNLMELILLDTRLEGRDKQVYDATSPELMTKDRTMLGNKQKKWFLSNLKSSNAQWKIIANQVIFTLLNVSWTKVGPFSSEGQQLENNLLDYWLGYPLERDSIINFISQNTINNVVMLSASMHCALAADITQAIRNKNGAKEKLTYNPITGQGSIAVEFAAPSITSANFDEKIGASMAHTFESLFNKDLPAPFGFNPNPQVKFIDLDQHGYFILTVSKEQIQADWYFVEDIFNSHSEEKFAEGWLSKSGKNFLQRSTKEANNK
ncbi:alkaline phosphatase D family protein [Rhodocytophaga rosea]|uniref:Alkaline phosphatase D family protein n=1 Tax=Rhodocytophaga rosea TaxID=2704465 RepID=A0A6C0GCR8_9BACT|nr:alkaline phosphatase D family protein [Rhodocytophaga rosea]QHT65756.1 alkaline phosphatase D family protein [Rhodocytophaga rosea]